MLVKLFSRDLDTPLKVLEDEINVFLKSVQSCPVRYVSLSVTGDERVASVWYDESTGAAHRSELKEMVEDA